MLLHHLPGYHFINTIHDEMNDVGGGFHTIPVHPIFRLTEISRRPIQFTKYDIRGRLKVKTHPRCLYLTDYLWRE